MLEASSPDGNQIVLKWEHLSSCMLLLLHQNKETYCICSNLNLNLFNLFVEIKSKNFAFREGPRVSHCSWVCSCPLWCLQSETWGWGETFWLVLASLHLWCLRIWFSLFGVFFSFNFRLGYLHARWTVPEQIFRIILQCVQC